MHTVFAVVLPIFALILVGWLCRRSNRLGPQAASEVNKLVVWLCLPALLFKVTATATWAEIWQPGFLAAFTGGCLLVFGQDGLEPALIASLLVVCVLFAISVVCIEVGLHEEKHIGRAVWVVTKALGKNPLVVSPIIGGLWAVTGIGLPAPLLHFLDMLAAATTPCALVSLGLFLAQKQEVRGEQVGAWPLVAIKLVGQPLLTGFLAYKVFDLPPLWADSALLLSALPTGTGPFMLAEYYQREAAVVSRSILLSTLGSLVTLSLCLLWIAR